MSIKSSLRDTKHDKDLNKDLLSIGRLFFKCQSQTDLQGEHNSKQNPIIRGEMYM